MPEPVSAVGGSIWVTAGGSVGLVVGALGLTALGGVLLAKGVAVVSQSLVLMMSGLVTPQACPTLLCRRVQSSVKFSSHQHSGGESSQMPSRTLGRRGSDVQHSGSLPMTQPQCQILACSCSNRFWARTQPNGTLQTQQTHDHEGFCVKPC